MLSNLTDILTEILAQIGSIIVWSSSGTATAPAYAALFGLPILAGISAFVVRLVKKAR